MAEAINLRVAPSSGRFVELTMVRQISYADGLRIFT
jgi:hypothetical protein